MVIYFVHQDGCIKINSTTHLPNRIKLIEEETGKPVTLLGVTAGGEDIRVNIHNMFKRLHIKDDWYRANTELMEYIEKNACLEHTKPLNWQEIKEKFGCSTLSDRGKECLKLLEMSENLPSDDKDDKLLSIEEASSALGISPQTLRNWEEKGRIKSQKTEGGHRRYTKSQIIDIRKQQIKEQEYLLFDVTTSYFLDIIQKLIANFDPMEKVNIAIKQDSFLGKVRITIDSADGLNSVTKSFRIKD